eukprot:NODE_7561_length_433_cov_92.462963.p3 GENE.NODE_7561_length_433_cov_92.462963~~NODE_7561_length_433_cov_92.462963.p3  ORF type:complete len:54 (-),score=17.61 NODE_7561_length_433_cov_92.462963:133-294(-)
MDSTILIIFSVLFAMILAIAGFAHYANKQRAQMPKKKKKKDKDKYNWFVGAEE